MELLQSQAPAKRELLGSSVVRTLELGNWKFDLRMWTLDIRVWTWEPLLCLSIEPLLSLYSLFWTSLRYNKSFFFLLLLTLLTIYVLDRVSVTVTVQCCDSVVMSILSEIWLKMFSLEKFSGWWWMGGDIWV